jgi:hypothetical protein
MVPISTLRQMVRAVHKIPVLWKNIEREFTIGFADGTKTGKTVRMAFHFRKVPDPSDHESRWLVSGHDFTGCGKTHVLCQGTTLQAAEKLMFCIRARLYGCGNTHVLYQGTTLVGP